MHSPHTVKALMSVVAIAATSACARGPQLATPTTPNPRAVAARDAPSHTSGAVDLTSPVTHDAPPQLTAPSAAEIDALRPLLQHGAAILVRDVDGGAHARITLVARTHAPIATVHRVITTPGEYMTFMPTLRSVEVLTQHGNRTGFRFHVAAPMFDVTALCAMNDISDHRVDVSVLESETGPGGSRWDLVRDGESDTILSLTTWGDPSQGHWLLRQMARRSPAAIAGMNISADAVLALGVARRAEILSGSNAPVRPAEGAVDPGPLVPPPSGAWLGLTQEATVLAVGLNPEWSVTQVTVASAIEGDGASVLERLRNIEGYPRVWGSIQSASPEGTADAQGQRYRVVVDTPISHLEGVQRLRIDGNTVWQDGIDGDFQGNAHRWDLVDRPGGGHAMLLTGGSDYNRAGWLTRALMSRDPWLMAGFAGSWKIIWLRHLVRGQ